MDVIASNIDREAQAVDSSGFDRLRRPPHPIARRQRLRGEVDAEKVRVFLRELARRARGAGNVYVNGGASAALVGWRQQTIDIDLKLDPEPPGVFEAIAELKDELDVNVELASPDLFIPELPDWRQRSPAIDVSGRVCSFHYDFRGQALAKVERGHGRDLADVRAMLERGLVSVSDLQRSFAALEPQLRRYPALDARTFEAKLKAFLSSWSPGS